MSGRFMSSLFRKKTDEEEPTNFGLARVFKYEELKKATNSFTTELGIGGFGSVYLGTLRDGQMVAVKILHNHNPKRLQQFVNEVIVLSRLRHKNLVTLHGCTNPRGIMRPTMKQVLIELKLIDDELQQIGGLNAPVQELGDDSLIDGGEAKIEDANNGASIDDPSRNYGLSFLDLKSPSFDLEDLLRASAEAMGKGKLGTTYRAKLESGPVVMVKRLVEMNALSKKEFSQQMQLLGWVKHENLVEILAFHSFKDENLMINENVPGASLYELLHGAGKGPLNWAARLSIVKGMARGLAHLHNALPSLKVLHANLKSSNVLVVQNNHHHPATYHAKLADFGFLPFLQSPEHAHKLAIASTPELSQDKQLSQKADIYCFGLVLLEVITGQAPGEEDLPERVRSAIQNDRMTDILDLEIAAVVDGHEEILTLTKIALECTSTEPERRPEMSELVQRIEEIGELNSEEGSRS